MSAKPYNEPAFPVTAEQSPSGAFPTAGMTLRDYFAAHALKGLLAHPECDYTPVTSRLIEQAPADAYALADAMLEQRGKQ